MGETRAGIVTDITNKIRTKSQRMLQLHPALGGPSQARLSTGLPMHDSLSERSVLGDKSSLPNDSRRMNTYRVEGEGF